MRLHRGLVVVLISLAAMLGTDAGFAQAAAHDPASVRAALGVLNRVVGHTQRLIAAGNLARLPHEDGEFKEGVEALERAIATEPAALREKLAPLIKQAEDRSHALAAASGHENAASLNVAHEALAESVRELIAVFPENERPAAAAAPSPAGVR